MNDMMEIIQGSPDPNKTGGYLVSSNRRLEELDMKIKELAASRVEGEQLEQDIERENRLFEKDCDRSAEEDEEYQDLKNKRNKSGLIVRTICDFRYVLISLGYYSAEKIRKLVSHENAHANKMQSLGVNFIAYQVIPFRMKNGDEGEQSLAINDEFPEDWTRERKKRVYLEIARAPEEYESGEPLSSFDRNMIDRNYGE